MKVYGQYSIKNCVSERAMCYKKVFMFCFQVIVSEGNTVFIDIN